MPNSQAGIEQLELLTALVQELRTDMNFGFEKIHYRIDEVEKKYKEAVEVLPLMRAIQLKLDTVISHMEDGGEKASLLKTLRFGAVV